MKLFYLFPEFCVFVCVEGVGKFPLRQNVGTDSAILRIRVIRRLSKLSGVLVFILENDKLPRPESD